MSTKPRNMGYLIRFEFQKLTENYREHVWGLEVLAGLLTRAHVWAEFKCTFGGKYNTQCSEDCEMNEYHHGIDECSHL